jgi:protein involved in polysaccharide export with SLBB domain
MFVIFEAKIQVMKRVIKILLFMFLAFAQAEVANAQLPVNIETMSDEQLASLISKYQLSGMSEAEIDAKAREFGLPADQIEILKKRIAALSATGAVAAPGGSNKTESYVLRDKMAIKGPSGRRDSVMNELRVYGSDIFDNSNLSFEPNLSIATPQNYVIGVNDQLVIDVYGISDNTTKLKVTTEGDIRFPKYGPIKVAGLTIEEARVRVRKALTRIYPGIATGAVSVQVSVGQIRSIQVTLLGEIVRPGTYTVSALSTLMNALYASGGPNSIGSLRDVELVRNGQTIVHFDLYDFLLRDQLNKNVLLQDGDVIRVRPYQTRVSLKGALKKPAIFDVKPTESALDIVKYAGGFADLAYKERVRVTRFGQADKEVLTVKAEELNQFKLVSGDVIVVDTLSNIFTNRVTVTGSVYHPGAYGIKQVASLRELLTIARPKEDAYYDRALLRRYQPDYTSSFINFNVKDALSGAFDLKLEREDSIHIYRRDELREKYTVNINGEVNKAGTYTYYDNMTVQDLVLLANGYREGAALQKIEISRRLRSTADNDTSAAYSIIKEINLGQGQNVADLNYKLTPFDVVSIRKSPSYKEQISVTIEGEVKYPGSYTLSANNERVSDIIKRAGGLKPNAFIEGAMLIRNTYVNISRSDLAVVSTKTNLINQQSGRPATKEMNDSALISNLSNQQKPVGIRLANALQTPGSQDDVFLEEGDILKIPKTIQTIQTFGSVNVPKQIVFRDGLSFKEAIMESGGFSVNAVRRNSYVVYANGEVGTTKKFLFFHSYPAIKTGAELYVPAKREGKKLTTGETIGLISGLASILGLLVVIINTSK